MLMFWMMRLLPRWNTFSAKSCQPEPGSAHAGADFGDVKVDDLVRHVLHGVAFGNTPLQDRSTLEKWLRRREEGAQLGGQSLHITGRNERHIGARDNLRNVADISGDQRHLSAGRL